MACLLRIWPANMEPDRLWWMGLIKHFEVEEQVQANTLFLVSITVILDLFNRFEFCSFLHVKRLGNGVVYVLVYLKPHGLACVEWLKGPNSILDLTMKKISATSPILTN